MCCYYVHFSVSVQQPKTEPIINHSVYCEVPNVQIGKFKSSNAHAQLRWFKVVVCTIICMCS